jgi:mono/diheme cytochrome c family protein
MKRSVLLFVLIGGCATSADRPVVVADVTTDQGTLSALLAEHRVVVVAMTSGDCPIAKLYAPKLKRIAEEYGPRGAAFVTARCNEGESRIAAELGATRTTEVFVVARGRELVYRGAVDDQYGLTYTKDAPTQRWLIDAIEAALAGRAVTVKITEAAGCAIEQRPNAVSKAVTFHRDVEPILQRRCQECHRPGEIGPFSLLSYESARKNARTIKEVVTSRRMPPWHADPKIGAWENDRRLSDAEIETVATWVDGGAAAGEASDAPAAREWPKGWRIGTPDQVYTMEKAYRVKAEGTIPYQYFEVKTELTEDVWVQAMEIRPGARQVVHHILVFLEYPRARGKEQPPIDGGLFYGYFGVMVPGEQPMVFPDGMGKKVPVGGTFHFQIHYTANGEAAMDQSSIGLVFAKKPVTREVVTRGIINQGIKIPAGKADHEETATITIPYDAEILSFLPHMHVRGKAFRYVAIYADKTEEVLLDVPAYDFRWQTIYRLKEPKLVKKGTKIKAFARWDNSAKNPANPDATQTVFYGEQTWEEMLNGYVDFVKAK